jgi:post-segregation antitoxin (ccd killing protein)
MLMPKTTTDTKIKLLCTRVTAQIEEVILQQASQEGLNVSEWLRNLIIKELRERQALPKVLRFPEIEKERR